MKRTLEDLWNGNIAPGVACGVGVPEIEELVCLMERNRETLSRTLNDPQKEALQKYIDCSEEYLTFITAQAFSDGFCLAGRLMAEVLSGDT